MFGRLRSFQVGNSGFREKICLKIECYHWKKKVRIRFFEMVSNLLFLAREDLIMFQTSNYQLIRLCLGSSIHINHIRSALRSLAVFHAANLIYERLEFRPSGKSIGDVNEDVLLETSCRRKIFQIREFLEPSYSSS